MKNAVYILAKQYPVTPPELFASIVSMHFIHTYEHIHVAHVKVVTHRWTRMTIDGAPHPHAFLRDGAETRNVEATARGGQGISIRSSIAGLLVLKSTGSQFHGFIRDDYTTLPEVSDRILSTEVACGWTWKPIPGVDEVKAEASKFDAAWDAARFITLKTFATDSSASVQNTMYKMCGQVLDAVPDAKTVDYALPNRHYFEIGMSLCGPTCRKFRLTENDRLELAQRPPKHWEGCRSVCTAIQSQRPDPVYRFPTRKVIQVVIKTW